MNSAPMTTVPEELKPITVWVSVPEQFVVAVNEFLSDWKKGDFSLGTLAAIDAQSIISAKERWADALARRAAISPPIDAGWQMVPKEPTPAMIHEYCELFNQHGLDAFVNVRSVWPKLLAAAPHPAPIDGYLFELCYSHENDRWSGTMFAETLPDADDVRNVRPLYTHPAPAPGPADAVSEAEVEAALDAAEYAPNDANRLWMRAAIEAAQRARK